MSLFSIVVPAQNGDGNQSVLGHEWNGQIVPAVPRIEQPIRVVLRVVLAGEEHHEAPAYRVLDALDNAGHPGQTEERAYTRQRDDCLVVRLLANARQEPIDQIVREHLELARRVARHVFRALEVRISVLLRSHPFGKSIGDVDQQPAPARLLRGQGELFDVGAHAEAHRSCRTRQR